LKWKVQCGWRDSQASTLAEGILLGGQLL
jgi:hypothetical protein